MDISTFHIELVLQASYNIITFHNKLKHVMVPFLNDGVTVQGMTALQKYVFPTSHSFSLENTKV